MFKKVQDYVKIKPIKVYAIINYSGITDNILDVVNLKQNKKKFTENLEYKIFDKTKVNKDFDNFEFISLFKETNIDNLNKIIKNKTNKEILEKMKKFNLDEKEYKKMNHIAEMMVKNIN